MMDAGSKDHTVEIARNLGVDIACVCPRKGRAAQMNHGAAFAYNRVLYFVHADTLPPVSYADDILQSIASGFMVGSYRSAFDGGPALMQLNAFFTRFNTLFCRGGDQSLFVGKNVFHQLGGFDENYQIMEDFDFIRRVKKVIPFRVMPKSILISARKFDKNNYLRVNLANIFMVALFRFGASQTFMARTYRRLLRMN